MGGSSWRIAPAVLAMLTRPEAAPLVAWIWRVTVITLPASRKGCVKRFCPPLPTQLAGQRAGQNAGGVDLPVAPKCTRLEHIAHAYGVIDSRTLA